MKKLFGTLVAVGAMALMAVGVQAATYSASSATVDENDTAVVNVLVTPGAGETELVNGYVMTFTYDSSKVTPVVSETADAMDEDCYATVGEEFANGVLVAGDATADAGDATADESSTTKTLAVAWAGAEAVEVSAETEMVSVEFKVVDEDASGTASIELAVVALTNDGETLVDLDSEDTTVEAVSGEIIIDIDFVLGDVNADGEIDGTDVTLLTQLVNKAVTIDELESLYASGVEERSDVNEDSALDGTDVTLLTQFVNKAISSFK